MFVRTSIKYRKKINVIHPGECFVSAQDEIISTLLGSCVSVCLYDQERQVSGMNHFMLPGRISEADIFNDRSARYGITAMNNLFHEIDKLGAEKKNLKAKIFGGGKITSMNSDTLTIPRDNVRLAKLIIEMEDIPIVEIDVGNVFTRKLYMDVKSGKVFLKKTTRAEVFEELNIRDMEIYSKYKFNEKNKSINS